MIKRLLLNIQAGTIIFRPEILAAGHYRVSVMTV